MDHTVLGPALLPERGDGGFFPLTIPGFWVSIEPEVSLIVLQFHSGPLSRTESTTSRIQRIPSPSPPKAAPKLKYSHVVESTLRPCDPGKLSPDLSRV